MTPLTVEFTGLILDPTPLLQERIHRGVFPSEWQRYRFPVSKNASPSQINRWLTEHIEGRWAILFSFVSHERICTIAFEKDFDASMFVLSDGPNQCYSDQM
jgi:hypothetical protein